jgi:tetratricopeptide (TPR) repeat protein
MNRTILLVTTACAVLATALGASPPSGSENYYTPPKLAKQGTSATPIEGAGKVVVQVLVNPDGSFKVQKVLRSTNHGDDATALDIARASSYTPAKRGGKKVLAFYDFTLSFKASGVSSNPAEGATASGTAQYERELRAGNYKGAQAGLKTYLADHPADAKGQLDLGIADAFLDDYDEAVAAFDKAGDIPENYKAVAAKAYTTHAVQLINNKNYQDGLAAAKRAVQISPSFASYDTQGMAELGAGDNAAAVADLEKAHALAKPDISASSRAADDIHLLQAYLATGNVDGAKQIGTEAGGLDARAKADSETFLAQYYAKKAQDADTAGKFADAAALYEQAAAVAPSQAALLYGNAAFSYLKATPQPLNDKAKADADKALAADANSAAANFAEGVVLGNLGKKSDAQTYLKKADDLAKAANNTAMVTAVERALKQLNGGSSEPQ